jgi:hypothetical protein
LKFSLERLTGELLRLNIFIEKNLLHVWFPWFCSTFADWP